MENIQIGCVDIWVDEIVPCLKDTETGEIKETAVFGIQSRSYLNKKLLNHYIEVLGCSFLGVRHPYHFMLDSFAAKKLLENYTYEWN